MAPKGPQQCPGSALHPAPELCCPSPTAMGLQCGGDLGLGLEQQDSGMPGQTPQQRALHLRNGPALPCGSGVHKHRHQGKPTLAAPAPVLGEGPHQQTPEEYSWAAWLLPSAQTSNQESKGGQVVVKPVKCPQLHLAAVPLPASTEGQGAARGAPTPLLPVRPGTAPATTAFLFNSQQLRSHAARQIHFRSPQLNVGNYGCLHQGTALPRLRRKNHILIPLRL